jgi:hypothetical protein
VTGVTARCLPIDPLSLLFRDEDGPVETKQWKPANSIGSWNAGYGAPESVGGSSLHNCFFPLLESFRTEYLNNPLQFSRCASSLRMAGRLDTPRSASRPHMFTTRTIGTSEKRAPTPTPLRKQLRMHTTPPSKCDRTNTFAGQRLQYLRWLQPWHHFASYGHVVTLAAVHACECCF